MTPSLAELQPMRELIQTVDKTLETVHDFCEVQFQQEDDILEKKVEKIEDIQFCGLIQDSSKLIEAHAIQLLFMVSNEPFTPSAIMKVLKEINDVAPTLPTSLSSFPSKFYTVTFRAELAHILWQIIASIKKLVNEISQDGVIVTSSLKSRLQTKTATIKNEISRLQALINYGPRKVFIQKIKIYRDLIADVETELRAWPEDNHDDDEFGSDDDRDAEEPRLDERDNIDEVDDFHNSDLHPANAQALIDHMFQEPQSIPKNDPKKIRPRLNIALRKIRLTTILCDAIIKRRMMSMPKFPIDSPIVQRIDKIIRLIKQIPDNMEDLAGAFYNLNRVAIDWHLDHLVIDTCAIAEGVRLDWDGKEDKLSEWVDKFIPGMQAGLAEGRDGK